MSNFRYMLPNIPKTLALDFDGVLCDGLKEYFQTAWRVYRQTWPTSNSAPPDDLAETFYRLRPVVETGWEMPVLLRAILKGFSESDILEKWKSICARIVAEEDLNPKNLGARVDAVRDQWIADDLNDWLKLHRFYPGVRTRLQQLMASEFTILIITTKESRFVQQLLQQEGIQISGDDIFGKEYQRPKSETLRTLQKKCEASIWFVEDRLSTLEVVKSYSDLSDIELFLAGWGYNTPSDRKAVAQDDRIRLLSLAQFTQDFSVWS